MDLQGLLKKTEQRSTKIKNTRTAASVAIADRPYTNDLTPSPSPTNAPNSLTSIIPSSPEKTESIHILSITEQNQKTGHKSNTNRTQTAHKSDTQPDTNRAQIGHKSNIFSSGQKETGHKSDTQPDTHSDTNRTQTAHKPDTNLRFSSLVGLQREVAIFIYRACQFVRAQVTDPLTLEHISASLKIRIGSAKTTLRRLEEKEILERVEFKAGRGGWSKYRLPESIFREMLQHETGHKLDTNRTQTGHKSDTQPDTQPDTSLSSSSSSIDFENFKTTTTGEPKLFEDGRVQLSPDWSAIDTSPLIEIGFAQTHLIQLAKYSKLSVVEVQDSIYFFAFDLKRNGKGREIKGPPVNFFMGILRKGLPYAAPENYESPEAEARRHYLESKRRIEEQRQAEERELRDLEFAEWRRGVSQEEINVIVPAVVKHVPRAYESSLEAHFDQNVWPARRARISRSVEDERAEIRTAIAHRLER